ncbi:molybdenum cofactor guanylyltransferase, partial [Enterococcus faecalis]
RQEFEHQSVKTVQLSKENQLKNDNRKEELSQWYR